MNISYKAACYLCNSHGPHKLRRDCSCVGERDGVVHYTCLVGHARAISEAWNGTNFSQYITPWKECPVCKHSYWTRFAVIMVVHYAQFVQAQLQKGDNWKHRVHVLQNVSPNGPGSNMSTMQQIEINLTAMTLQSLIKFEWSREAPRSAHCITMVRNCEYALALMSLVPEGSTGIQDDVYICLHSIELFSVGK